MIGRLFQSLGWAGQGLRLEVQASDLRFNEVIEDWKGSELVLLRPEQLHFLPPGTMLRTIDGLDAFLSENSEKEFDHLDTRGGYLPLGLSVDSPLVKKGYLQRVVDDDSELATGYVSDVRSIEYERDRYSLRATILELWDRLIDRVS